MSYYASAASSATRGEEQTYHAFGDEELARPGRAGEIDTSGDEALARALAQELQEAGATPDARTERDEDIALALAMAMEDEAEAEHEDLRRQQRAPSHPREPQRPQPVPELAPQKQQVDISSVAQSMFDRLMAPFRRRSSTTERDEMRKARDQRVRQRNNFQSTVISNVMEIHVPDFIATENFLVMKPDGSVSRIHVPRHLQRPAFYITYDGEPLMNAAPRILDEAAQNAAFLDFYRFDPFEIEAEVDIIPGPRTLGGLELVSQPEGVFVKWGVFPLPPSRQPRESRDEIDEYDDNDDDSDSFEDFQDGEILETGHLICAGDLIVQVGDTPTTSLESLRLQLAAMRMGTKIQVRALRRPPPIVRCPMGHALHLDDPRASPDSECDSCRMDFGRHHCVECGFALCWPCHQIIYAHSKARFPRPVNNDHEFAEAPRTTKLTFSPADVGVKVLIYWYTTAEWWIGQIESYDPVKGHTLVYEERNGNKGREIIPNFAVREYRILTKCVLQDDVESFHQSTLGDQASMIANRSTSVKQEDLLDMSSFGEPHESGMSAPVLDDLISSKRTPTNSDEPLLSASSPSGSALLTEYFGSQENSNEGASEQYYSRATETSWLNPDATAMQAALQVDKVPAAEAAEEEEKVVLNDDEAALLKEALGFEDDDNGEGPP